MFKEDYNVIGVMSGTSLDGVDLAYINFEKKESWSFKILFSETISYSIDWVNKLKKGFYLNENELIFLNESYTDLLATIILEFIEKYSLVNIDAICSHGHTILHQPENGFTLQIGNLPKLGSLLNYPIVCDFRVQDVVLGGQGAPLVPIGDQLLFSNYDYCMNLGGFSNMSFEYNGNRIAYDISPVNTVLNYYVNQLGMEYDNKGKIAKSGLFDKDLFEKLNQISFYNEPFPKSLGMEFVHKCIFPIIESFSLPIETILRTFVEHIAFQIAHNCSSNTKTILITGGGAYNEFLIERIQYYLPKVVLVVPDKQLIEFKEALIFGFLGVLKLRNENNTLASVTGAVRDHSSGVIYNVN